MSLQFFTRILKEILASILEVNVNIFCLVQTETTRDLKYQENIKQITLTLLQPFFFSFIAPGKHKKFTGPWDL